MIGGGGQRAAVPAERAPPPPPKRAPRKPFHSLDCDKECTFHELSMAKHMFIIIFGGAGSRRAEGVFAGFFLAGVKVQSANLSI